MLSPRRRAMDRTGRGFEYARDYDTRASPLDVHVEFDGLEERGMDSARHRPIDPPVGCPFVGLATVEDGSQSVSLPAVRPRIDDGLTLAIALVDRSRPSIEEGCAEAIERHVSEVALVDENGREATAVPVRGTA